MVMPSDRSSAAATREAHDWYARVHLRFTVVDMGVTIQHLVLNCEFGSWK